MESEDNAMKFERIVSSMLCNQPYQIGNYYAGIYNTDVKGSRALLYAICIKERDYNKSSYTINLLTVVSHLQKIINHNNIPQILWSSC